MHLRITNKSARALDDYRFTFGSAGALELTNEYSGLAALPARSGREAAVHTTHQI